MSIRPKQDRRLQDALEGTATPEEVAELRTWLASSAEGRERERELRETFRCLEALALEEPPAGLSAAVMARVAAEPRAAREGWQATLGRALLRRPAWGLGYAFAAGLVAGAVAIGAFTGAFRPAGRADLPVSATLMPPRDAARADAGTLSSGDAAVGAGVWRRGDTARLRLEGGGRSPGEIVVAWNPSVFEVSALHWSGTGARRSESAAGRLVVELSPGARCAIDFQARPGPEGTLGVTLRGPAGSVHREFRAQAGGPRR
jgi:hypothetical protein